MKPSTAKRKGAQTEIAGVRWLKTKGAEFAERMHLNGRLDLGDVAGIPNVCVEIKSGAVLNIQKWLRELAAEMKNSSSETGVVLVRPNGKPEPEDWFVVMPSELWSDLMIKAGYWPAPEKEET